MIKLIKRLAIATALLAVSVIVGVFLYFQLASESSVADTKVLLNALAGYSVDSPDQQQLEQRFHMPEGFTLDIYATDLGKIRFMHLTEQGDLLLTRPRQGDVLLLERDDNGDGKPDGQRILMEGLYKPHGIDISGGWIYIAESTAVGRVRFDAAHGTIKGQYQRIVEGLSDSGNHWTKTVAVGPDGFVYLSSGSTCNVCEEEDEHRATIMRFNTDGSEFEIFATGLRNSVGFDWAPWDNALYATDNGRDLLGDDFPVCELNKIERGAFYGWPYVNGMGVPDPDMTAEFEQSRVDKLLLAAVSPVHGFRAHNAPLGIQFLRHSNVPGFERAALVALHGSWNRSERDGYKVVSLHWQSDNSIVERELLTGFNSADNVIGRPADVEEGVDGTLYISDDYSGTVYRMRYGVERDAENGTQVARLPATNMKVDMTQAFSEYSDQELKQLRQVGEAAFQQYRCGNCHDPAMARPMRTIKTLENLAERYSLVELANFFLTPTPPMPVFPLNESQREGLAIYLYER